MELSAQAQSSMPTMKQPRPHRRVSADLMAFRARVKELIEEAGSEVALERRAGMPTGSLSHYSRSQPSEPLRPHLVALAAAAGVHLDWLCTQAYAFERSVASRIFDSMRQRSIRVSGRGALIQRDDWWKSFSVSGTSGSSSAPGMKSGCLTI